jgi:hypothetical protein
LPDLKGYAASVGEELGGVQMLEVLSALTPGLAGSSAFGQLASNLQGAADRYRAALPEVAALASPGQFAGRPGATAALGQMRKIFQRTVRKGNEDLGINDFYKQLDAEFPKAVKHRESGEIVQAGPQDKFHSDIIFSTIAEGGMPSISKTMGKYHTGRVTKAGEFVDELDFMEYIEDVVTSGFNQLQKP